jgi:hypothetical protein
VTALWVLLGFAVGGAFAALVLRRGGRRRAVPGTGAASSAPASDRRSDGAPDQGSAPDGPAPSPSDVGPAAEAPLPIRPHPSDPVRGGNLVLRGDLGDLATSWSVDGGPALGSEDIALLEDAVTGAAGGGVLVLPGPSHTVLGAALHRLHARLGDVPVFAVPAPRRAIAGDPGREPFLALDGDATILAAAGTCVVLVEEAELHLRRGLDAARVARIRAAAPAAVLVLHVGACVHDASVLDDVGAWLERAVASGRRGPSGRRLSARRPARPSAPRGRRGRPAARRSRRGRRLRACRRAAERRAAASSPASRPCSPGGRRRTRPAGQLARRPCGATLGPTAAVGSRRSTRGAAHHAACAGGARRALRGRPDVLGPDLLACPARRRGRRRAPARRADG